MLENFVFGANTLDKSECKARLKERQLELSALQLRLKENKLPVIVLVEGWGAAGKGSLIHTLIRELDPRFFNVISIEQPTREERRWPFLKRFFEKIPAAGKIVFLDSGWLDQAAEERLRGELSDSEFERRLESIRRYERQLAANGYLLVKFFLHVPEQVQRERLAALEGNKDTSWRAADRDWRQNKSYERLQVIFDQCLEGTDAAFAPWQVLDGTQRVQTHMTAAQRLCGAVKAALERRPTAVIPVRDWPLVEMPRLADVPLDKVIDEEKYAKQLKKLRRRLGELHNELYRKQVPVVVAYEGWDAAGKGGNIKRLTSGLDPRGYEVHPIASPTPDELSRHYLWRFWTRLPKTGHIAVFDRSWYGRVMVERLEGFCSEAEWKRAYDEINEFERELTDAGMVVLKFWVQIDKDTQLERFTMRQNTPEKQWKITDEDWRNREKWDLYEQAVNEMLQKTSTENAPWYILESVDKKYARIRAMKLVIRAIEEALR